MAHAAHRKASARPRSSLVSMIVAAVAVVGVIVAAATYAVGHRSSPGGSHVSTAHAATPSGRTHTPGTAAMPMSVFGVSPATAATNVASNTPILVEFTGILKPGAPTPTITPAVAGTWSTHVSTMTFTPTAGYLPFATESLSVPAGIRGTINGRTVSMASAYTATFRVAPGSTERLQQLLAELNYLPLGFTPSTAGFTEPGATDEVSITPVPGTLTWKWPSTPASLAAQWAEGQANGITRGAVMAFEADHNLAIDGSAGPAVWAALITAAAAHQATSRPYDYLMVSQSRPENLTVWQGGATVYTSAANTGVPGATTAPGTFPVFERFQSTTMRGKNPDGSTYSDPGVPWVAYFNGGDAVHGFPRASYGSPQSDGCVELPIANAQVVWGMDYYGTLVTVA